MSEIAKALRAFRFSVPDFIYPGSLKICQEGADEIDRLRSALEWIKDFASGNGSINKTTPRHQMMIEIRKKASEALGETSNAT